MYFMLKSSQIVNVKIKKEIMPLECVELVILKEKNPLSCLDLAIKTKRYASDAQQAICVDYVVIIILARRCGSSYFDC